MNGTGCSASWNLSPSDLDGPWNRAPFFSRRRDGSRVRHGPKANIYSPAFSSDPEGAPDPPRLLRILSLSTHATSSQPSVMMAIARASMTSSKPDVHRPEKLVAALLVNASRAWGGVASNIKSSTTATIKPNGMSRIRISSNLETPA
jgi:hypothetical protein